MYGGGGDGGRSLPTRTKTSFSADSGISRRPASAPENGNSYSRADSEPAKRDRVALGNSGSSRGPGLSAASTRLGCTPRERRERERGREKGYRGGGGRERASCNLEKNVRRWSRRALLFVLPADPPTWPLLRAPDQKQPARPSNSNNSSSGSSNTATYISLPFSVHALRVSRAEPCSLLSFPARGPAPSSARGLLDHAQRVLLPRARSRARLECAAERNPINPRLPARGQ